MDSSYMTSQPLTTIQDASKRAQRRREKYKAVGELQPSGNTLFAPP